MVALPTPTQEIIHPLLREKHIRLFVKRDDLIHPEIMGNKWRKLNYNIEAMRQEGKKTLITMGGAFSNHIAATAAAAKIYAFEAIGVIRGEELNTKSNTTLELASKNGMTLEFISRQNFKDIREKPSLLTDKYPDYYFLPEGGTNDLAIKGTKEILEEIEIEFDVLATPIGTGGTFAGLLASSSSEKILGISSLKGSFMHKEIADLLKKNSIDRSNYQLSTDYHFGGYGKTTSELIDFINWFKEKFNIPLDPIYTGKSFFGVWDMIKKGKFEKNLKIVLLHTGGLQSISGFNRKNENIIQ
ncbi:1-aminocyclopropane-1-carboxylate deaminase/D-cysteine desulfhydrase [Ekhidna sp.]